MEQTPGRTPFGLITDVNSTTSKSASNLEKAKVSPLCCYYLPSLNQKLFRGEVLTNYILNDNL